MYKHQDPLNKIYTTLITEGKFVDHTSYERDQQGRATKPVIEPGLHVFEFDEIRLKSGEVVPGDVFFSANWQNEDWEYVEGRGRYKTQDAGFYTEITKVLIPPTVNQAELDEWTGKPGTFKPGTDITALIDQKEADYIRSYLDEMYNNRDAWPSANDEV